MKDILVEWNPWWSDNYDFFGIHRKKLDKVLPWIKRKEICAIIGVRRSGKTNLFYQIINYLIKNKIYNKMNILFIKADDDRINKKGLIDKAIDEYKKFFNPKGDVILFIDEIQEISNWESTIKRIYDLSKDIKIFISGSNSSIIKEELSSVLAGRFAYFEIYPFSFKEFLTAKKIDIDNEIELIENKSKLRHSLIEFITFGGFPEIVLEKDEDLKKELLGFYFDSIFYRDTIKRKNIRNPAKMEMMVKYYLQNLGNLTNFTKVGKLFDLTTDSITEYTKIIEEAYLVFSVNLFDFSYKKQIVNPKKIYCVDTGIRNLMGFIFSRDIGRLFENIVYLELKKKNQVFYWKNTYECDFVIKQGTKIIKVVQVCYDLTQDNQTREYKGLLEAMNEFKLNEGLIITDNKEKEEIIDGKKITVVPLWKWMIKK